MRMAFWRPKVELKGADVSVSNAAPTDHGHQHSRMWVQHLTGAVALLEDEVNRGIGDVDEKRAQIADKLRQIAVHSALHPDDSRDAEYMALHVKAARAG